jgi:hypothetical protein
MVTADEHGSNRKFNGEVQHRGEQEGICHPQLFCQYTLFILPKQSVSAQQKWIGRAKALPRFAREGRGEITAGLSTPR